MSGFTFKKLFKILFIAIVFDILFMALLFNFLYIYQEPLLMYLDGGVHTYEITVLVVTLILLFASAVVTTLDIAAIIVKFIIPDSKAFKALFPVEQAFGLFNMLGSVRNEVIKNEK